MSHEWDRGVLAKSSWHGLEEIGTFTNGLSLIEHGEESGALPVELEAGVPLSTPDGLIANVTAIVARYRNHTARVVGAVGGRYRHTTPGEFRELVHAIADAGATPTGIFSLREGSRVVATFEVSEQDGKKINLIIADAFDGSMKLMVGFTVIDVVCSNTLAAAFRSDGEEWAKIRHTASLEDKIQDLIANIPAAIKSGESVAALHEAAAKKRLTAKQAHAALDLLAPLADEDASQRAKTRAENRRAELLAACALPINRRNNPKGSLATLWNAATYVVDRREDGTTRETRGGELLDSMLFGSRGKRVEEIQHIVEIIMADGSVQEMTVSEATTAGVDSKQLGAGILEAMLEESN